jgi:hypothetical protein
MAIVVDKNFVIDKKNLERYNNFADFPASGITSVLYLDNSNNKAYTWNGLNYVYFDKINPNNLTTAQQATEAKAGKAEIATQAQVNAGVDDLRFITPLKLANYTGFPGVSNFVEEKTPIAGSNAGAWVVRNLGASYANKRLEIIIQKNNNAVSLAGVRAVGSAFDLSFILRRSQAYRQVTADAAGDIEIFSNNINADFYIIGSK